MFEMKSIYFNTSYLGPTPVRAANKIQEMLRQSMDPGFSDGDAWFDSADRVRAKLGQLIGCPSENVAISTSVSELISHVANGLMLKPGDEVLLMDGEYPSMVLPWLVLAELQGFKVRLLDLSFFLHPSKLITELTSKTKFVGVSHVMFNTGAKLPIAEIGKVCRAADVLFLSDTSQSFGGVALTQDIVQNVDILVGVCYKWLLGSYGSAYAYFSDRALARVARTHASWLTAPGWKTRENLLNYTTVALPGARRFDRGQAPNFLVCAGLEGSFDLLLEVGLGKIQAHNESLVELFFEHLPSDLEVIAPREFRSNIICVKPSGQDAKTVKAKLATKNIDVSIREGYLRLAFHFFNTREQVQKLIEALD